MACLVMIAPALGSVQTSKVHARYSGDASNTYVSFGSNSNDLFDITHSKFDEVNTISLIRKLVSQANYNKNVTI